MSNSFDPTKIHVEQFSKTSLENQALFWTDEKLAAAKPIEAHPQWFKCKKRKFPTTTPKAGGNEKESSNSEPELVQSLSKRPYSAVGRLYFVFDGQPWHCTATILDENSSCLITAAHCVYPVPNSTGEWISDVIFQLQYNDGKMAGQFSCATAYLFEGWVQNAKNNNSDMWNYDVALINVPGRPGQTSGGLATAFGEQDDCTMVGYPGGYPNSPSQYDGKRMWEQETEFVEDDGNGILWYQPYDLYNGASGGPMLTVNPVYPEPLLSGIISYASPDSNTTYISTSNLASLPMDALLERQADDVKEPPSEMTGYLTVAAADPGPLVMSSETGSDKWQVTLFGGVEDMVKFRFKFGRNEYGQDIVTMEALQPGFGRHGQWTKSKKDFLNQHLLTYVYHSKKTHNWRVDMYDQPQSDVVDAYISPGEDFGDQFWYVEDTNLGGDIRIGQVEERMKFRFQSEKPSS